MKVLSKLAHVLTSYANSDTTGAIPKVHIHFEHDPSDVPGVDQWSLTVKLMSFDDFDKHDTEGNVVPTREKIWEVAAATPEICAAAALKVIGEHLQAEFESTKFQVNALESTLAILNLPPLAFESGEKTMEEMAKEVPPAEEDVPDSPQN
jgi:hypothetical protein